ncbi:hypothetical protein KAW18_02245 [candidate division WOR-3 bacterium]|nr:hypothetical protein [candidate division WOR-3 bacterium]
MQKRELKFRYVLERNEELRLFDISLIDCEIESSNFEQFRQLTVFEGWSIIDILQYIEREDIHKEKLCEGDIVKWINNYGEENTGWIRYSKAIAGFNIVLIKGSYQPFYTGSVRNFSWGKLEKIGNVYGNPEMLEKAK